MSAAPVYPQQRPRNKPLPQTPARTAKPRARRKSWSQVFFTNVLLFTMATTVTFGFSTLLGYSMKEAARHQAIRDGDRAKSARADMSRIKSRIERLSTLRSVDEWSQLKGFVTTFQVAKATPVQRPASIKEVDSPKGAGLKVDVVVARVEDGTSTQ